MSEKSDDQKRQEALAKAREILAANERDRALANARELDEQILTVAFDGRPVSRPPKKVKE
jgi:hypothetical protein